MSLKRRVGFFQGLKYQGGGPMLAWMLHRITGVSIILFVGLHVTSSFFMQQFGSDWAIFLNTIYESWIFQIYIVFCVLFHALNGLRIALLDLWPKLQQYQREALWLEVAILTPVYALTVFILVQKAIVGG